MTILVIDDQPVLQDLLKDLLEEEGWRVLQAYSAHQGKEILEGEVVDGILLDLMLPDRHGLDLLTEIKQRYPLIPVVVITAYSALETAIEAMKRGAFHYIPKPFKNEEVILTLRQALEKKRIEEENLHLREALKERYSFANIIGRSAKMQKIFELIQQAAPSNATILITGESGTGKELVAKAIHYHSTRAKHRFMVVNCSNIPSELMESQLFGYEKGAFTGAYQSRMGVLEHANKGTIFFDEIGNISLEFQAKLLRLIQEKEFTRLGSVETQKVDVRFICATNADLEKMVKEGKFREDLFYRIHVITLELPPLRERREDIPLLIDHFVSKFCKANQKPLLKVSPEVEKIFMEYPWPGNVRELENALERAVVLTQGDTITPEVLPRQLHEPVTLPFEAFDQWDNLSFKKATEAFQRQLILRALYKVGGVQRKAAALLKMKPNTLNMIMKRLEIKL